MSLWTTDPAEPATGEPPPPADPGPPGDPGEPPARRFPEGFTLGAAAVLGAVIVLAGLLAWVHTGRTGRLDTAGRPSATTTARPPATGEEAAPTTTTAPATSTTGSTASTVPSTTSSTAAASAVTPLACPAGTDPVICDAATYVQVARAKPFKTFPSVELLTADAFTAALLADFDQEARPQLDARGVTLKALGLLDAGASLADVQRGALEVGVVGFYAPDRKRLVVRSGSFNLYARQVLVHELTHALDDQWFDLNRRRFADGDAEYAFTAVAEGNARRIDQRWGAQLTPGEQSELAQEQAGQLSPQDLLRYFTLPPVVQQLQISPYTDGLTYMTQVATASGESGVDEAFTRPPTSSEEILHPGTSRSRDPELAPPQPRAEGTEAEKGRLGELVVSLWLGRTAARGWGGDRFVSWRDAGGRSCLSAELAADTPTDLTEIDTAARAWAAAAPQARSVEAASGNGLPLVRVRGCTP